MTVPALEARDLDVHYGAVRPVAGVSLDLRAGTLAGLIGPNGAGKTTLLNALSGFARATGSVRLAGAELIDRPPDARARAGLVRTFQQPRLFAGQRVLDHLLLAIDHASGEALDPAEVAELVGLGSLDRREETLNPRESVLLELARAVVQRPAVLLIDEPAAGFDPAEVEELAAILRAIRDRYAPAMLVVDHDMNLILGTSDVVHVLDFGALVFSGTPDEARESPIVIAAYLGDEWEDL